MASDKKNKNKKFCLTVIPKDWPQFTGPAYKAGMTVGQANQAWSEYKRAFDTIGPTPKVYRSIA